MKYLLFIILIALICFLIALICLGCPVYDPQKETILIINNNKLDTIYIFSNYCLEHLDSILTPKKYRVIKGFDFEVRNPCFIDPLNSQKIDLGFTTLLTAINSCEDKEAKLFVINEENFKKIKDKKFLVEEKMIDTIFSLTEESIKKGVFIYK